MKDLSSFIRLTGIVLLAWLAGCSREAKLEDHLKRADGYFANRDFEKAKLEFVNVLRLEGTNAQAFRQLGKIFYEQGQLAEAYPLLERSRDAFPDDLQLREALIVIYTAGRTNKWRDEAAAILKRAPTNEVAVLALVEQATNPAEQSAAEGQLGVLRKQAGERAIFDVAMAEIYGKRGDLAAAEKALRQAIAREPKSVVGHLALGNFLAGRRQLEEATRQLQMAAELAPVHDPARLRLAQFQSQNGRLDEAKRILEEILAQAPERTAAWVARSEIALKEKNYDESSRLLERALSQSPRDFNALSLRAQLKLAQNQPAEAVRQFEQLSEMFPRVSQIQYQLGLAYLLNKDINRALGSLRLAVTLDPNHLSAAMLLAELQLAKGQTDEATAVLTELVRRSPQLEQAQMLLGRSYRAAGRLDDAVALYRAMVVRFPKNPAPAFQLGLVLRQQKQDAEARKIFEQILQTNPENVGALEQLVGLDIEAKSFPDALRRLQQAIDERPAAAPLWLMLAQVQTAQTNLPSAEAALKKAIEHDPNLQAAYLALAEVYVASGRRSEALKELDRVLAKDPGDFGALVLSGILQADAGNLAKARAAYERALKGRPNSLLVLNNLAYLLAERLDKLDEGRALALKGRQLAPEDPIIAETLGWIEFRRGDYAEALRILSASAEKIGRNPEVQYHLGMAYYMTGQEIPARIALEKAVKSRVQFTGKAVAGEYLEFLQLDSKLTDDERLSVLEKRRKMAPTDVISLTRLGALYETRGEYVKALEAYETALKINSKSVPLLARLARLQAEHLNNPERALGLARSARALAPEDPEVALSLGRLALTAGDPQWSYSLLQESARRLTNRPELFHDLAFAAYGLGRVEEANRLMEATARSNGPTNLVRSARGFLAMSDLARNPAALVAASSQIAAVLKSDPNHGPALFVAGLLAEQQGRYSDARVAYERLLVRYPGFVPATRQLALLYADRLGDDAKGYEFSTKARSALPKDEAIAFALGKLATRRGEYRYAVQLLREAGQTRDSDAELFYQLGLAYKGLKQNAESKAALEKALNLAPNAPFAVDAKKVLAELAKG